MIACSYFIEHFQARFDITRWRRCRWEAAGETEATLGDAAIGFVVERSIFRTVDEIDSIAAHAAAILTEATAVALCERVK